MHACRHTYLPTDIHIHIYIHIKHEYYIYTYIFIYSYNISANRNLVPIIGSAEQAMHDLETVGLLTHAECEKLRFSTGKAPGLRMAETKNLAVHWQNVGNSGKKRGK